MNKKFEDIAGWYLIANVKKNIPFGETGEIRKGTKHFPPNTKVYEIIELFYDDKKRQY